MKQESSQSGSQGGPVRVVVVDDSALMLKMISALLNSDPRISVVGCARDTNEGRRLIRETDPDVITLDVEMPGMNGLEFLHKIMTLRPTPVVMVSTLTAAGTDVTLTALEAGAVDVVAKPNGPNAIEVFGEVLRNKVRIASRANLGSIANASAEPLLQRHKNFGDNRQVSLIAMGASTGGVSAISSILSAIPHDTPPIVITQHMPPEFTRRLASRLDGVLPHKVREARNGERLGRNDIRIAPGNAHLEIGKNPNGLITRVIDADPVSGHRPSVDVLFGSVASTVAADAIGVILTGMGRDGAEGLLKMRRAGAFCLGQTENTCVVYGMPKAAKMLDAVSEELPLPQISKRICTFLNLSPVKKAV